MKSRHQDNRADLRRARSVTNPPPEVPRRVTLIDPQGVEFETLVRKPCETEQAHIAKEDQAMSKQAVVIYGDKFQDVSVEAGMTAQNVLERVGRVSL